MLVAVEEFYICAEQITVKNIGHENKGIPAAEKRFKKYVYTDGDVFKTRTHHKVATAFQYLKGLFQGRKRNIERMAERVADSEYHRIQHFISESPWDARVGFDRVASNVSKIFEPFNNVGLLIDESSHLKKGTESVGVSRQYAGTIGKVDNCQVAVYAALSAGKYYGLIDTALHLPKTWTDDTPRCLAAGIAEEQIVFKTKVEQALEIVQHQISIGTRFHFVAADALYGNSYWFQDQLDQLNQLFVLDVHCEQYVYSKPPQISIPEKTGSRGRTPCRYKTESAAKEVQKLAANIPLGRYEKIRLRETGKGDLNCMGYVKRVYIWDGSGAQYAERLLVIRLTISKDGSKEYKYALSNARHDQYTTEELVRMLSQRYFVERCFQDAKQEAGMSEYQVRGWLAWHHHMVLVMMALSFILSEKVLYKEEYPLLSAYDIREIMLNLYSAKGFTERELMQQIRKRHQQRIFKQNNNTS
mgnify:FL=1